MQRTKLFLLRHGETLSNIELRYQGQGDSDLSELGIKETYKLAEFLQNIKFKAIYCSPLIRSKKTAEMIKEHHPEAQLFIEKDLMERYYGCFEDKSFDELKNEFGELYTNWLKHPAETIIPEAETLEQLSNRAVSAIEKIIDKHQGGNICVVGHGGTNRTILFHYMNLGLENFFRIKQDNCCVNIIEFNRVPMVMLLNSTYFLGEKRLTQEGSY